MRDWVEMPVFRGIDLIHSHVRAWSYSQSTVLIELLFALTPAHPFYVAPTPGTDASHKAGKLLFSNVTDVSGFVPMSMANSIVTPMGYYDFGVIETLAQVEPGLFELSGLFGNMRVRSEEPVIVYGAIGA